MNITRIQVTDDGPYAVDGNVELVDADDNAYEVPSDQAVYLCRCGRSAAKPFCDGSHLNCGFEAHERASGMVR